MSKNENLKEFNYLLLENEEILWQRRKTINLLRFIYKGVLFIIIFTLVCGIFILIQIFLKNLIGLILVVFITIIADLLLMILGKQEYRKRKKTLKLSFSQLRNYEFFDILTNKRYLRRNYFLNFNKDLDYSTYPPNSLKIIDDKIIIFNLDFVSKIILDKTYKNLHFLVKSEKGGYASDVYIENLDKELDQVINMLRNILLFTGEEINPDYIEFYKKEN